jgi:3-oxoacyl-[acyl-carrier protein] reductase
MRNKEDPMKSTPILQGKRAVVFGAGGSIGTAVAKEFAAEGAEVFLAGRTQSSVEAVARSIAANGGKAQAAVIDTLNDAAVNQYFDGIVKPGGKIDIVLDAAGPLAREYGNGKIAIELPVEEFIAPLAQERCPAQ